MPHFSLTSRQRLASCHPDLQRVLEKAIEDGPDFTVLCGYRGPVEQHLAYSEGRSQLCFPKSPHNVSPSRAVDLAPYPIDWDDTDRFRLLAGYILGVADGLGVKLRWGGDWDCDYDEGDERFRDLPHFELLED